MMNLSEIPSDVPLTIITHHSPEDVSVDVDDVMVIDPQATATMSKQITPEEWAQLKEAPAFLRQFRLVMPDVDLPDHPLQMHGSGVQHIVGLILLTELARMLGKRPLWRYPESHLHPCYQTGLADLAILLSKGNK